MQKDEILAMVSTDIPEDIRQAAANLSKTLELATEHEAELRRLVDEYTEQNDKADDETICRGVTKDKLVWCSGHEDYVKGGISHFILRRRLQTGELSRYREVHALCPECRLTFHDNEDWWMSLASKNPRGEWEWEENGQSKTKAKLYMASRLSDRTEPVALGLYNSKVRKRFALKPRISLSSSSKVRKSEISRFVLSTSVGTYEL